MSEFIPYYGSDRELSLKAVFDALDPDSMENPDWCADVLSRASKEDIEAARRMFEGETMVKATDPSWPTFPDLPAGLPEDSASSRWSWMSEP